MCPQVRNGAAIRRIAMLCDSLNPTRAVMHVDFSATNNVFMVRARQLDNLGDPDYFIKKVQMCEDNRRRAAAGKA